MIMLKIKNGKLVVLENPDVSVEQNVKDLNAEIKAELPELVGRLSAREKNGKLQIGKRTAGMSYSRWYGVYGRKELPIEDLGLLPVGKNFT